MGGRLSQGKSASAPSRGCRAARAPRFGICGLGSGSCVASSSAQRRALDNVPWSQTALSQLLCHLGERERVAEGQRERETQNPKQAPGSEPSARSPSRGSNPRTARSRPEPKSDASPTEHPRRPLDSFLACIQFRGCSFPLKC
ncbi:Hypothetical predicted protein [Lynx pardinus]|uniref:Uncharacterized protein n=1 Tax=Lynx pardinus TaxID=191816 RepID=A0A485NXM4_LYNPA|nr:Hypothetical predicted protein [Lynx pardinus]